jgi:hypothetical protein
VSGACEFKQYQPQQQNDFKVEEPEKKKLEVVRLPGMATLIDLQLIY